MKKFFLIIGLVILLSFPVLGSERRDFREKSIIQTASFVLPLGLSIWGFRQKSGYGTTTGIIFSLNALINLFKID